MEQAVTSFKDGEWGLFESRKGLGLFLSFLSLYSLDSHPPKKSTAATTTTTTTSSCCRTLRPPSLLPDFPDGFSTPVRPATAPRWLCQLSEPPTPHPNAAWPLSNGSYPLARLSRIPQRHGPHARTPGLLVTKGKRDIRGIRLSVRLRLEPLGCIPAYQHTRTRQPQPTPQWQEQSLRGQGSPQKGGKGMSRVPKVTPDLR